ncbi:MAG TPA: DinB family protein [Terracidiphilus sp.]|jgi:uncharacterized damage-inducible protein DinB
MTKCEEFLMEFRQELATTRRVLERVPADKLPWKPHEKSMSLGTLAMHIAMVPGGIAAITRGDSFDLTNSKPLPPTPASTAEIFTALERSVQEVETAFKSTPEEAVYAKWRMVRGDREIFAIPRFVAWRSIMLNHWYHHRGQLSVYLRLLDVALPSIYGPSADESPFG